MHLGQTTPALREIMDDRRWMTYTSGARTYSGVQDLDEADRLDLEAFVGGDGKRRTLFQQRLTNFEVVHGKEWSHAE